MELKKTFYAVSAHGEWWDPLETSPEKDVAVLRFRLRADQGGKVATKMFEKAAWQGILAALATEAEGISGAPVNEITLRYQNRDEAAATLYFHTDKTNGTTRPYDGPLAGQECYAPIIYRK